jgi:hypothetical protein
MQYLFYVDDDNIVRHVTPGPEGEWIPGNLITDIPEPIKCAAYSKLAAITFSNRSGTSIMVYYQCPDKNAAIKSVNFKERPVPPVPPVRVTDPPLYGTSLTAVLPRPGLQVDQSKPFNAETSLPVVYLQWHSLEMAHSQGSGTLSSISD